MLATLSAFAVTIGLLLLTLHLLKRLQGRGTSRGRVPLAVLQRVATGPRQGIGLVRVADRVLVVSFGEHGATLLTELGGSSLTHALGAESPNGSPVTEPMTEVVEDPPLRVTDESPFARALRVARTSWARRGLGLGALVLLFASPARSAQSQTPRPAARAATITAPATAGVPVAGTPARGQAVRTTNVPIQATAPRPGHDVLAPHAPSVPAPTINQPGAPKIEFDVGQGSNQLKLSGTVGLVVFLGALTLLPALFLLMTSFTRILIVLSFLKSALGTQTAPPSQLIVALAVMLTGVVMHPVLDRVTQDALTPYFENRISQVEAYDRGVVPFREFMLANLRPRDIDAFADMSGLTSVKSIDDVPTVTIVAAFVTSELRTSFQMGFAIYLPFVVVDLIVASVLMSMGMMMVPPVMVSLPFKLLLFVLADGWTLIVRNLVSSFHI